MASSHYFVVFTPEAPSVKANEALHASGSIRLPSQCTLKDCTHCLISNDVLLAAIDSHLMEIVDISKFPEFKKNVVIIMAETYSEEDTVQQSF